MDSTELIARIGRVFTLTFEHQQLISLSIVFGLLLIFTLLNKSDLPNEKEFAAPIATLADDRIA